MTMEDEHVGNIPVGVHRSNASYPGVEVEGYPPGWKFYAVCYDAHTRDTSGVLFPL